MPNYLLAISETWIMSRFLQYTGNTPLHRISPRAPRSIRSAIVSCNLPSKIKIPEVDASRINVKSSTSRQRGPPEHANRSPDIGYIRQEGTSLPLVRNILDFDSSSDNSSLFSHSGEVSSNTDSNRESISADDFSEYTFGYNAFFRQSTPLLPLPLC